MRLLNYEPIKHFHIENMGSTVVIAGANGSGKTRLKQAIVETFQGNPSMDMWIESTRKEEHGKYFGGSEVIVEKGNPNQVLTEYINSRKYGSGRYVGSLVQIDSNRSVQTLSFNQVNWLSGDPDDFEAPSTHYFKTFSARWQEFINYIHQKSAARDKKLAEEVKKRPELSGNELLKNNPDPIDKYKKIFSEALPGKELLDINPAQPGTFKYKDNFGQELNFETLSSGEQEIIKILFDVARKEIKHSIIIIDEPELHLHPSLTFKLIETLKNIGEHTNQFIFLTHSPDLISTYYSTGDVYFIDSLQTGSNQAHRLSDVAEKHHKVLPLIGQNLGLFAVGKKLVFVEGEESSIDRLTYQEIAQTIDKEIRVIPIGSVFNIMTLHNVEEQIRNSIFGIDLYMVRDRDGLDDSSVEILEKNGRIHCLKRRHIENYFLDEEILYKVSEKLYLTKTNSSITIEYIKNEVKKIANNSLGYNIQQNFKEYVSMNHFLSSPSVKNVHKKSIDIVKNELSQALTTNIGILNSNLSVTQVKKWIDNEEKRLKKSLNNGTWVEIFQGKYIFNKLCGEVLKEDPIHVRHAYIDIALESKNNAIEDIINIFKKMKFAQV